MSITDKPKHWFEPLRPFVFGGFSACMATCTIQPVDTVKVRIQSINENNASSTTRSSTKPLDVGRQILKQTGIKGLYKGLDAAILRQVVYGTIRLGLFQKLSDDIKHKNNRNLHFSEKAFCSLFSGLVGSVIGNPADVALVRFQVDSLLPEEQRRNYKNVGDALTRMVKEEGLLSLWRGCTPTVVRAMVMNFGMLSSYDQIKEGLSHYSNDPNAISVRIMSSVLSGIIASCVSLPPDNVKTKIMKMKPNAEGVYPYKGFMDCFAKSVQREGVTGLWVGLPTYIFRVTPHAIVALLINDLLNTLWKRQGH
ncbi:Mitochondrial carrier domain [Pseudocohnilembus persalinus]|uniref:Mitochondrial carrier domain n=1 Tax=Pseudocohnilembus persalinus TaxID=266149 RepID=A0A0V0QGB8_PSEPJ|nr:Mitochondrial carrier domain [Pseudocohnilembus persalinus]|eukprot:KRX01250.1 Mitochondrial carrier domain [Pseudocohnilembus persalinus]